MLDKIKGAIIPHLIGFVFMLFGWYISIINVGLNAGLTRYGSVELFSKWTTFGFLLILIGAYLPGIYIGIRDKFKK